MLKNNSTCALFLFNTLANKSSEKLTIFPTFSNFAGFANAIQLFEETFV